MTLIVPHGMMRQHRRDCQRIILTDTNRDTQRDVVTVMLVDIYASEQIQIYVVVDTHAHKHG